MRDIIKRILKEANDFDWMREPINPWLEYDGIIFDIEPTREDVNMYIEMVLNNYIEIYNKQIGNADAWETGRERDIDQIIGYHKDTGGSVLAINRDGYLTFGDKQEYYGSRNLIRYSQLIEQEPLTESNDDWDWYETPLINPWELGYTGIDFDVDISSKNEEIKKFREDVVTLIELALNRGDISNVSDWERPFGEDVNTITDNLITTGTSYLAIEHNKSLTYGTRINYTGWEDVKFVKYSHLIGDNQLTESIDDFGWIDDIPESIELQPRTIYYAEPPLNGEQAIQLLQLITNPPKRTSYIIKRIKESESTLGYITVDDSVNWLGWNNVGGVSLAIENGLKLDLNRKGYDRVDIGILFRG